MNLKFGTDGIRGPVETHITPEACLRVGHATGIVMKEQGWDTVMIGKDTRLRRALAEVRHHRGCRSHGQPGFQGPSGALQVVWPR